MTTHKIKPARYFLLTLALIAATPALAETTLVCDLASSHRAQDTPTILTLNEPAQTVSGKLGADHVIDPGAQGRSEEISFPPAPAEFKDQEIIFAPPKTLPEGHKFHLNRLTGELLHFTQNGFVVGDQRRCHTATKQF